MTIVLSRMSLCAVLIVSLSIPAFSEELLTPAQRSGLLESVTRIRYERLEGKDLVVGHGTAFGINLEAFNQPGRRYLLSAAHNVLDRAGKPYPTLKIEIPIQGGRTVGSHCRVISADNDLDLCLLECDEDLPAVVALAPADEPVKAPVILAGSPRGIPVQLFDGTLVRRFHEGSVRSLAELEFDHGCSGGPVFSARTGKVIGVAVAGIPKGDDMDHTKGLFVPASAIESFIAPLSKVAPAPSAAPSYVLASSRAVAQKKAVPAVQIESATIPTPKSSRAKRLVTGDIGTFRSPYGNGRESTADGSYVVQDGDTLGAIALDFHVTAQALMKLNELDGDKTLIIGTTIRIR
jgi:LysM repeat protein